MYVNYDRIINEYETQFKGAYEKANNWPLDSANVGWFILAEEIDEVADASKSLHDYFTPLIGGLDELEVGNIKGHAVSVILEALQVIAVCNKYNHLFIDEAKRKKRKLQEAESAYTTCPQCGHQHRIDGKEDNVVD